MDRDETQVFRSYSLGAVDFIKTPVVPEILKAKVAVFVDLFKKTEQVKRQAEQMRLLQEREHASTDGGGRGPAGGGDQAQPLLHPRPRHAGIADFDGHLQAAQPELGARRSASATRS